jgi:hypothetical protein
MEHHEKEVQPVVLDQSKKRKKEANEETNTLWLIVITNMWISSNGQPVCSTNMFGSYRKEELAISMIGRLTRCFELLLEKGAVGFTILKIEDGRPLKQMTQISGDGVPHYQWDPRVRQHLEAGLCPASGSGNCPAVPTRSGSTTELAQQPAIGQPTQEAVQRSAGQRFASRRSPFLPPQPAPPPNVAQLPREGTPFGVSTHLCCEALNGRPAPVPM